MANPLRVNASELLRRPGSQKTVELSSLLAELEVVDPVRFADDAEVSVRLHLEALNDGIVVDGELSVPWHGVCRRCLADTGGTQVSEVHELYQRTVTDPEAFEIVGDQLDLRDVWRGAGAARCPQHPAVPARLRRSVPHVRRQPQRRPVWLRRRADRPPLVGARPAARSRRSWRLSTVAGSNPPPCAASLS